MHPGTVAARVGSKQRPRAARAEAARAGRWWPWLDFNGVIFFFVQHDRGRCRRLQRQYQLRLYKYLLVPGTWYVWSPYHTKKMKGKFLRFFLEPRIRLRFYTRTFFS